MDKTIFIILGIAAFLLIVFIIAIRQSKSQNNDNTNYFPQNDRPKPYNTTYHTTYHIDEPILTNHARERIAERLNVYGCNQEELMNNAFKHGRTANRANGDLKATLEEAERKYEEDSVAKFYNGSIFIFTKEENILQTVYKYDTNKRNYWH